MFGIFFEGTVGAKLWLNSPGDATQNLRYVRTMDYTRVLYPRVYIYCTVGKVRRPFTPIRTLFAHYSHSRRIVFSAILTLFAHYSHGRARPSAIVGRGHSTYDLLVPEGAAPPQGGRRTSPAMDRCAKGEGGVWVNPGAGTAVTAGEVPQLKVVSCRHSDTRKRPVRSGYPNPKARQYCPGPPVRLPAK